METIKINFKNCYGIPSLEEKFDFKNNTHRAYTIYAPNGAMKTSFTRVFEDLSNGKKPKEERYNRTTTCVVEANETTIAQETIYVLKAEMDISADSSSITNILVDPKNKARYDELLVDLDKLKIKLIKGLSKSSSLKQSEIEQAILRDWQEDDFSACIEKIRDVSFKEDLSPYTYNTVFDPKALALLKSKEFILKAKEFNQRYQKLFEQAGSIYKKGVFNPSKAETSFKTLNKHGFFAGGHRVHLKDEDSSISKEELDEKLKAIHANIDGDTDLKKIKDGLAKNAQTDALAELIEELSTFQFDCFLENLKPENQNQFRKELWAFYIQNSPDAAGYLKTYADSKDEIQGIESEAAKSAPRWEKAIELFNDRFVDMPFTLSVVDQAKTVLGRKDRAQLKFTFTDGEDTAEYLRNEVKSTLSQGERRALYLLNFIFDVEERKMNSIETVFVLDDVADSFDYKNKHAIIQYLRDLTEVNFFHQIILTHNFDFFRALSQGNGGFVHRARCLMTSKGNNNISLSPAEGISNYFVKVWKPKVISNKCVLYATISFTRNIIEYTQDYNNNPDYLKLTSLLHWKQDTDQITVGQYLDIYNKTFNTTHNTDDTDKLINVLYTEAQSICNQTTHTGLNLEDKVLLSISTRIKAEKFLTDELRNIKNDTNYWYQGTSDQFRGLLEEYKSQANNATDIRILEKVGITVNSNIHLNSFMYEPILDLTIDHLIALYIEVSGLNA
ncbi:MAG: hypothetical protein KAS59_02105 [Alphaproteobacteria bacterium]|nr:hypothetical protein [Alphaproteobacteria bacterium]